MGASQAELDYRIILRGETDARRFGCNQALEIQKIQQGRLQELTLDDRAANADEWFVWKHHRPLRHRVDITGKPQCPQILEKGALEQRLAVVAALRRKISNVSLAEVKFAH